MKWRRTGPSQHPWRLFFASALPSGEGWQFEPKWDGFRCLALRDGGEISLTSKSGKPLGRYFPDIVEILASTSSGKYLIDGELIIPVGDLLSFEALQMRLHPAATRVKKLALEHPAQFMLFDLLKLGDENLTKEPLTDRRQKLEQFFKANRRPGLHLSPVTKDGQKQWNG